MGHEATGPQPGKRAAMFKVKDEAGVQTVVFRYTENPGGTDDKFPEWHIYTDAVGFTLTRVSETVFEYPSGDRLTVVSE